MLPAPKPGGRPRRLDLRQVINAILYLVVGGIQSRMMPQEYPKWQSVQYYFRAWCNNGLWKRIHDTLRARVRENVERHKHPRQGSPKSSVGAFLPITFGNRILHK